MRLIGQDVLNVAVKKNAPLRKRLVEWAKVVEESEWQSLDDVRKAYPSADGVTLESATVITVFNIKGNSYRLLTWIDYSVQVVEVLEVISHPEYNKNLWKKRY